MAALMKATIDRDEGGVVTTTYGLKTISLAKARARRERPPGLKEEGEGKEGVAVAELEGGKGLGIGGLEEESGADAGAGAEQVVLGEEGSGVGVLEEGVAPDEVVSVGPTEHGEVLLDDKAGTAVAS